MCILGREAGQSCNWPIKDYITIK